MNFDNRMALLAELVLARARIYWALVSAAGRATVRW